MRKANVCELKPYWTRHIRKCQTWKEAARGDKTHTQRIKQLYPFSQWPALYNASVGLWRNVRDAAAVVHLIQLSAPGGEGPSPQPPLRTAITRLRSGRYRQTHPLRFTGKREPKLTHWPFDNFSCFLVVFLIHDHDAEATGILGLMLGEVVTVAR